MYLLLAVKRKRANSPFVLLLNLPIFVTNNGDDDDFDGIDDVEKGRDGWAGGSIVQDSGKGGAC